MGCCPGARWCRVHGLVETEKTRPAVRHTISHAYRQITDTAVRNKVRDLFYHGYNSYLDYGTFIRAGYANNHEAHMCIIQLSH